MTHVTPIMPSGQRPSVPYGNIQLKPSYRNRLEEYDVSSNPTKLVGREVEVGKRGVRLSEGSEENEEEIKENVLVKEFILGKRKVGQTCRRRVACS